VAVGLDAVPLADPDADGTKVDPGTARCRFSVKLRLTGTEAELRGFDGWLLQRVTHLYRIYRCRDCDCGQRGEGDSPPAPGGDAEVRFRRRSDSTKECDPYEVFQTEYVEGWHVVDGDLYHGLFKDQDKDPQDTFATRPYGDARRLGFEICGRISITGVMKLFAEGDLPDLLRPGKWDDDPASPDHEKSKLSGKLPSSERPAVVDAFDRDPRGQRVGPEHVLEIAFDNCGKPEFAGRVLRRKP
jgi:hypothetical protein